MEGIQLVCTRVKYRAAVNSELLITLTVQRTGNFLIRRLLKIDSHVGHHKQRGIPTKNTRIYSEE
jgi:hypothetical protein